MPNPVDRKHPHLARSANHDNTKGNVSKSSSFIAMFRRETWKRVSVAIAYQANSHDFSGFKHTEDKESGDCCSSSNSLVTC